MLIGNQPTTAERIAYKAKISEVKAKLLPENKVKVLHKYQSQGKRIKMVKKNINNAPTLTITDVNIGMGSNTDVALETTNIILIRNDLNHLTNVFQLNRETLTNIHLNLFWTFAYNVLNIPITAGMLVPFNKSTLHPVLTTVAITLISVCVITNTLHLRRFRFQ